LLDTVKAKPLDYRAINRRAWRHWRVVHSHLVDLHGRILVGVLQQLNPEAAKRRAEKREPARRLEHFTIGDGGSWRNVGSGSVGPDVISLVQWLAHDCTREAAAEWLDDLTGRIVEVAA
jgi:hypothetical protein